MIIYIYTPNPWITFWISFIKIDNLVVSWGSDIVNQKNFKIYLLSFSVHNAQKC